MRRYFFLFCFFITSFATAGTSDCNGTKAQFAVGAGYAYPAAAPAGHGAIYAPLAQNHGDEAAPVAVAGVLAVGDREEAPTPQQTKIYNTGFQELPSKGGSGLSNGFFGTVSCDWGNSSSCSKNWNSGIAGE